MYLVSVFQVGSRRSVRVPSLWTANWDTCLQSKGLFSFSCFVVLLVFLGDDLRVAFHRMGGQQNGKLRMK